MSGEELCSVFTNGQLDRLNDMLEERKISLENAIPLLKHMGYCKVLKGALNDKFAESSLGKRLQKMIVKEKKKKNEKLLVDLCECYFLLNRYYDYFSEALLSICVPCLLKVALNKEERKENQKEVEMALLAMSNIGRMTKVKKELFLNELKEIILNHQERNNLTRLAHHSAWRFLIERFYKDQSLKKAIENELRFVREATRELEELSKSVNWNRKGKEAKEEVALKRWIDTMHFYITRFHNQNEEYTKLAKSIVGVCREAKFNHRYIYNTCCSIFRFVIFQMQKSTFCLLGEEIVYFLLEEMHQPTIEKDFLPYNARVFYLLSRALSVKYRKKNGLMTFLLFAWNWLNGKAKEENEKEKQKETLYRELREKMEEEGYEDCIVSFYETDLDGFYFFGLPIDLNDFIIHH
eukprot:MONOS_9058.1-p1 / transcript=MONOS_9058.1 / gene=MONOS_9058 / organism=Monocercomonoides_exilis_PA203 / gene_product=unspecified product / transcript_product=unspecified product / location=Mono_scaffold00360:57153-58472(-) / protein_length=408 / sequence_SO=supercontig / SO=protein_coding / is_pseudo=false